MEYFYAKYTPSGFVQDSERFFLLFKKQNCIMALHDVMKGRILCMGTSPIRAGAHVNQSESNHHASFGTAEQHLLEKNVSK